MATCLICGREVPEHRKKYCGAACAEIAHQEQNITTLYKRILDDYLEMSKDYGADSLKVYSSDNMSQEDLRKLIPGGGK